MSIYALSIETFVSKLHSLSAILDKAAEFAAAKKFDSQILVNARLAPDMYPLSRQVQTACDQAKTAAARLSGGEPPRFEDNETTLDELKARIAKTVDYLQSIPASAFEGAAERQIVHPLMAGFVIEAKGLDFLRDWTLPNFYFHLVTAYNILRHNGVELGKQSYLGNISALMRQK